MCGGWVLSAVPKRRLEETYGCYYARFGVAASICPRSKAGGKFLGHYGGGAHFSHEVAGCGSSRKRKARGCFGIRPSG